MGRPSPRLRAFLRDLDAPSGHAQSILREQRPARFLAGLTAQPFHDPARFAAVRILEGAAPHIGRELRAVMGHLYAVEAHRPLVEGGAWLRFPFYNYGLRYDESCRACPATARVIESISGATSAGLAYFSALRPRTRLRAHCGPTNTRIRCHLPLVAPPGCTLTVGGENRSWVAGECVVFDDSFEHTAQNPTDEVRVVLIVDVWHPELTASERTLLAERFARDHRLRVQPIEAVSALHAFAAPGERDYED